MPSTVPIRADLRPDAAAAAPAAPEGPGHGLPDEPIVRIRPSRSWVALNLRDVWAYRELLFFLTWRDVNVRYKQTLLGIAWAVIQPLATMLIFNLFFGRLAKMPSEGLPYPLFALRRSAPLDVLLERGDQQR